MNHLILSDKHNQENLNKLKKIHGELLKFRAKFSSSPLSTTTAGKQQVTPDIVLLLDNFFTQQSFLNI
jgi:hypothetical protein